MSGRYSFQVDSEKLIVNDVLMKLDLGVDDNLLEIGCGPGNILEKLSKSVKSISGIDHRDILSILKSRFTSLEVNLFDGNFLDLEINKRFDKILVYSVLHYLESEDEVYDFIDKSLSLLNHGGKLLLGDLPNVDYKKRVMDTDFGLDFLALWSKEVSSESKAISDNLNDDDKLVAFTDKFILDIITNYRSKGYNVFLLPQNENLPFGLTREDILFSKSKK